jgi:serine/threonine-protein kinase
VRPQPDEPGATLAAPTLSASATLGAPPRGDTGNYPADPLVGSTVGSFRIIRVLGRGGMGTVYLAEHPVIGSRVAIKFLHESMASNADLVGRFYDEARAVNLIGHENIVGIFDLAMLPPNRYYIVMEYLEGRTLSALLRDGPVPPDVALDVVLQLCDALHCAHERGVVHRDLKPDNVFLLRRRGRSHFVKLVDFGIAKLRDAPASSHTAAGMIVGTPEYMAPEQCDNRDIDARTDLYALGVMAYQLATGTLPFAGRSVAQLLLAHLREPPPPPRSIAPSIHPALEETILRALAKRPEDRFPDLAAFARALEAAARPAAAAAQPAAVAAPPAAVAVEPQAAVAPPADAAAPAGLRVELRVPGEAAPRSLAASQLTRHGVHVHATAPFPAPLSRVRVALARPGAAPLELDAEVARVVSAEEAKAWSMQPGVYLQFLAPAPAVRAELERIAGATASPAAPRPSDDVAAAALLEDLHARASGTHYELLGLPLDAEFKEVQSRARSLRVQLTGLRDRKLTPEQAARVAPLLARVDLAASVLGVPAERLAYDVRHGNHLGVARCIAAGLPEAVLAQRRAEFLRARGGVSERIAALLTKAKVARAMGNLEFARKQYEEGLSLDPLNLDLQREYWLLRREKEAGGR